MGSLLASYLLMFLWPKQRKAHSRVNAEGATQVMTLGLWFTGALNLTVCHRDQDQKTGEMRM